MFIPSNDPYPGPITTLPSCLTPLFVARAATTSFLNPFRRAQAENASGQIVVQVKWGRDRFNIPIPQPSLTPLSTLLGTLSHQTSIPVDQLKLVYKGAVLRDPSLTISAYGIADGSTIVLVGKSGDVPAPSAVSSSANSAVANGAAPGPRKKNKQPDTDTERVLVDWIHALVSGVLDPLHASVATFVSHTSPHATNRPAHTPPFEQLQKEHARLSEFLLRGLLDLDGIDIPSGWGEARSTRKDGVKRVQAELSRIDDAWGERKRLGTS